MELERKSLCCCCLRLVGEVLADMEVSLRGLIGGALAFENVTFTFSPHRRPSFIDRLDRSKSTSILSARMRIPSQVSITPHHPTRCPRDLPFALSPSLPHPPKRNNKQETDWSKRMITTYILKLHQLRTTRMIAHSPILDLTTINPSYCPPQPVTSYQTTQTDNRDRIAGL